MAIKKSIKVTFQIKCLGPKLCGLGAALDNPVNAKITFYQPKGDVMSIASHIKCRFIDFRGGDEEVLCIAPEVMFKRNRKYSFCMFSRIDTTCSRF